MRAKQDRKPIGTFSTLPILIHGDAAMAGQGVVVRDDADVAAARLPHRRHHAHRHQQPGRLHDRAGRRPLVDLLDGCREDHPGADLPRERRRPRGRRARRGARVPLPPGVQARRRHRPRLLPPPRSQRGRRPLDDAAAHVQPHRGEALGPQALHRGARRPRRHHRGGVRGRAPRLPGPPRARLRRDARRADRRDPDHRRRPSRSPRRGAGHGRARDRPASSTEVVHAIGDAFDNKPAGFTRAPEDPAAAHEAPRHEPQRQDRLGLRRAARARLAPARGHPGAPRRPGRPPRHLRAAPRRASTTA